MIRQPPKSTLFPYTPSFRSVECLAVDEIVSGGIESVQCEVAPAPLQIFFREIKAGRLRARERRANGEAAGVGEAVEHFETRLRSEEHTSELQSRSELVCRLL